MEKQPCHSEWGRLKIKGHPLMSGAAIGSSQLMRVACRTSPCLVHIFEDGNLVSIWRFPADPVFLLFGPSFQHINVENIEEESKSSDCSLLVITSDGSIWLLDCWKEHDPSTERLTKKKEEAVPEEMQKAVQEMLVDESDNKPLFVGKYPQPKQLDNLGDVHFHGSQMSGLSVRCPEPIRRAEHKWNEFEDCDVDHPTYKPSANRTLVTSGLVDVKPKWTKVSSDSFPRFDNKLNVKLVSQEALLSYVPGTVVAAFGPKNSVGLLGVSGALQVIQVSSGDLHRTLPTRSDTNNGRSADNRESSFLLYASMRTQCKADEKLEGYVALLEAKFFQKLFGCSDNMTSPSGILHGDTKGHLYTTLVSPEREMSHTRLLCDFGQPVVAVLTIPATATSDKKDNLRCVEDSKITQYYGSSLLVIGQSGKVILITGVKETVVQAEDGLFWPTSSSFSWSSRNNTLTAKQLNERSLEFCQWEVFAPISSACMLGPHRLCYCTTSEVYYTDLFEQEGVVQIYPHHSKITHPTSAEPKDPVSLSLLKLSQKLQSSVSHKRIFKKELVSQRVPLADVVVAIVGRGICGGVGSSRPLVALTTRGRLLGVEVSIHVSNRALSIAGGITKSWRSLQSRMEERIQALLQVVGEVAKSTDVFQRHSATTTVALNELASALPLVKEICLYEMTTRRPDVSLVGEPPPGRVSSFLIVTDHTPVLISPENLSFGPGSAKFVPLDSFHFRKVKLAIRLCNQSLRFLSPYWSLLLELRSVSSGQSVHFSLPINRGLGLSVGAEYTHELIAQFPGRSLGPVLVYLFLCHQHNSHHLISKSESSVTSGKACPLTGENELCSRLVHPSFSKMGTVLGSPGSVKTTPVESSPTSGAVCLVLSRYRIDLLSLLPVTPPHLGIDTRVHLRMDKKHANMDASSLPDRFLGRFSSKFTLTHVDTPYTVSKDPAKLWHDFYLDDLLQRGSVSKAGQKISVSAFGSETFSISVNSGTAGQRCSSVEILLESSSLLLGSYLREALMWRLEHCTDRFMLKECSPWRPTKKAKVENLSSKLVPHADCYDETGINRSPETSGDALAHSDPTKIIDTVTELDERLTVILDLWRNVLRSPENVQFTSLLNKTFTSVQDVMLAYRACRADEPHTTIIK